MLFSTACQGIENKGKDLDFSHVDLSLNLAGCHQQVQCDLVPAVL